MKHFLLLAMAALLLIISPDSAHAGNDNRQLTLIYKVSKGIPLGKMRLTYSTEDSGEYRLRMALKGSGLLASVSQESNAQGTVNNNQQLWPQNYQNSKYSINFQDGIPQRWVKKGTEFDNDGSIPFAAPTLDPISVIWQLMPAFANNQHQCEGINYNYFNAKVRYRMQLVSNDSKTDKPRGRKLKVESTFSCLLKREKLVKNAADKQPQPIVFIKSKRFADHPVLYRMTLDDGSVLTLKDIQF